MSSPRWNIDLEVLLNIEMNVDFYAFAKADSQTFMNPVKSTGRLKTS